MRFNPFVSYKDKNGKKFKEDDVVVIYNERMAKPEDRLLIRFEYLPEINVFRRTPVIYNPNCCKACRAKWGYIWDMTELWEDEIEIIGNLKTNPELLSLKSMEEL